ncbi:integrase core domain-containing protein [Roseomonas xinghualingensis]|uniref:integrase core domain-containing protein n=1 Tax=Roseomonas xinghualingensis TaxID=2986475 RepID=UPI00367235C2
MRTLFIKPAILWKNGNNESFNGKLRGDLQGRETFCSHREATVLIERWRRHFNTVCPHKALRYGLPSLAPMVSHPAGPASTPTRPACPTMARAGSLLTREAVR